MVNKIGKNFLINRVYFEHSQFRLMKVTNTQSNDELFIKTLGSRYISKDNLSQLKNSYSYIKEFEQSGLVPKTEFIDQVDLYGLCFAGKNYEPLSEFIIHNEISLIDFIKIAIQLTKILVETHQKKTVINRMSPTNILINPRSFNIKFHGFELAVQHSGGFHANKNLEYLTNDLDYISPELTGRMNRLVDYRSDLYILGLIFYLILANRPPFHSSDPAKICYYHLTRKPKPITSYRNDLPLVIEKILQKLLSKEPDNRYSTASSLLFDLEICRDQLEKHDGISLLDIGKEGLDAGFVISEKIYGREDEIHDISQVIQKSILIKPSLLLLKGPPGTGKTTLINESEKYFVDKGSWILNSKCEKNKINVQYYPFNFIVGKIISEIYSDVEFGFDIFVNEINKAVQPTGMALTQVFPILLQLIGEQPEICDLEPEKSQNRFIYTCVNFIKSISILKPLVIIIDDLQWADLSTLKLLSIMLEDQTLKNISYVGLYRSTEVNQDHPLNRFINNLIERSINIKCFEIHTLGKIALEQMLADTLKQTGPGINQLAAVVYEKTGGNPFYAKILLKSLYNKKNIYFNYDDKSWHWNLSYIRKMCVMENISNILTSALGKLNNKTHALLRVASCYGNAFTLYDLRLVFSRSYRYLLEQIGPAILKGILIVTKGNYQLSSTNRRDQIDDEIAKSIEFKFSHDNIALSLYNEIGPSITQKIHFLIANKSLYSIDLNDTAAVYIMANHLSLAIDRFEAIADKNKVIEVLYIASLNHKNSLSYKIAKEYIISVLKLTDENDWHTNYMLMFNLYILSAECSYLLVDFESSDAIIQYLLSKKLKKIDTLSLYSLQITYYLNLSSYRKVLEIGRKLFGLMGFSLPKKITKFHVLFKLFQLVSKCRKKSATDLTKDLDLITDDSEIIFQKALSRVITASLLSKELTFYAYINFTLVIRSLVNGYCIITPGVLVMAASILLKQNLFNDLVYKLDEMSEIIAEKFQSNPELMYFVAAKGITISPFIHRVTDCIENLDMSYTYSLQLGDPIFQIITKSIGASAKAYSGYSLEKIEEIYSYLIKFSDDVKYLDYHHQIKIKKHIVDSLILKPCLNKDELQEALDILRSSENKFIFGTSLALLAKHSYHVHSLDKALQYIKLYHEYDDVCEVNVTTLDVKFYILIILAEIILNKKNQSKDTLKLYKYYRRQATGYYKRSPVTFDYFNYLFLAHESLLKDKLETALLYYSKCLNSLSNLKLLPYLAVLNEHITKVLTLKNITKAAESYIKDAIYYYDQCGAQYKVNTLKSEYLTQYYTENDSTTQHIDATSTHIDYSSIYKTSQVISNEMELNSLVSKLMPIIMENAGAENIRVFSKVDDKFLQVGKASLYNQKIEINVEHVALADLTDVPHKIINYVIHSKNPFFTDIGILNPGFENDSCFQQVKPKSILCMPILQKFAVTGILYMENFTIRGIFSDERIKTLDILTKEIATSIENAKLFQHTDQLYRAAERFVPQRFLEVLKIDKLENVRLGDSIEKNISVLFSDIRNYTSLLEGKSSSYAFNLINKYLQYVSPSIRHYDGFVNQYIGDSIMAIFPNLANDAVDSALDTLISLKKFNNDQRKSNSVELTIGIGIHSGTAMFGIVGEKERTGPSIIGDVINTSSRIEGLNKLYGTQLLISSQTHKNLKHPEQYIIHLVDHVYLKGKNEAIVVYEVLDRTVELQQNQIDNLNEQNDLYQKAFKIYQNSDFKTAEDLFITFIAKYPNVYYAKILAKRCKIYKKSHPPEDWKGIIKLTEK